LSFGIPVELIPFVSGEIADLVYMFYQVLGMATANAIAFNAVEGFFFPAIPQQSECILAKSLPRHKFVVQLSHIVGWAKITIIQDSKLPQSIRFSEIDIFKGHGDVLVVLGQGHRLHIPTEGQDIDLKGADSPADLERVFIQPLGLQPKCVGLNPSQGREHHHYGENEAKAEAQLRADGQIF